MNEERVVLVLKISPRAKEIMRSLATESGRNMAREFERLMAEEQARRLQNMQSSLT